MALPFGKATGSFRRALEAFRSDAAKITGRMRHLEALSGDLGRLSRKLNDRLCDLGSLLGNLDNRLCDLVKLL